MTRDNENVNDEKDYKGPVHPKDTEDYAACAKWEEKFINYCLGRSSARTLRTGEAETYPSTVESLLLDSESAAKAKGNKMKVKLDKAANGRVFGWLCQATENTAKPFSKNYCNVTNQNCNRRLQPLCQNDNH